MPELPDILVYLESLETRVLNRTLEHLRIKSPFVLRSVDPPVREVEGKRVTGLRRLGKRIVFGLEDDLFVIVHLMIAGRLRWRNAKAMIPGKLGLAAFDFDSGTLLLTEAASKKRAAIHLARGEAALREHDPGGIDVLGSDLDRFRGALTRENHTLKRALTDPALLSGIGNAYSDEILHRAKLSPFKQTSRLSEDEMARLHDATVETLEHWIARLREETADGFPERVTAFRDGMAVHGRYRKPCPVCRTEVQRIKYAENEANYCPGCQTGGKLLADRGISRLLKKDWPRTMEELEKRRSSSAGSRE